MNFKKKRITSKSKNQRNSKRKVRKDVKTTTRTKDCMRATRRNFGEGLGL